MSQVHSRTFRVPSKPSDTGCAIRRVMVPFVDLLNHDSDAHLVACEWGCEWRGLPDSARHVIQSIYALFVELNDAI